jgi:hypothetical protein
MRANEFIAEAFNQPYKTKTEKGEFGDVDVLAKLPDGTNLSIMFNNEGNDEWQVEFYRNNSQEVTGEGDAQRIFATVLTAIQQFVQKQQPWRIVFSASKEVEPGQNSESRAKLYDRLVQRYAASLGYDSYKEDHGDQVTYELTRLKQDINESTFRDHEQQLDHFVRWVCGKLDLDPKEFDIKFSDKKDGTDMYHTGAYSNGDNTLWVYTGNRNLVDIMRTVAHELVHRRQDVEDRVEGVTTGPGHPLEQEADVVAGTLMKLYAKKFPEIIE